MQLAVPPSHPLAARQRVPIRPISTGIDFIGFDEDLSIRREIDRFLRAHGVAVHMAMHFDNIQMIKEAVALGSGVEHPARAHHAGGDRAGPPGGARLEAPEARQARGHRTCGARKLSRVAQEFLELALGAACSGYRNGPLLKVYADDPAQDAGLRAP